MLISVDIRETFLIDAATMRTVFTRLTADEWGVLLCLLWIGSPSSGTTLAPTSSDIAATIHMKSTRVKKILERLIEMNLVIPSREKLTASTTFSAHKEPHLHFKPVAEKVNLPTPQKPERVKCVSPETFYSDAKMSPSIRKVSYAFFQAMGLPLDEPEKYIPSLSSWLFQCVPIARMCDPNGYGMIDAAVRKLRAANMTISSPASLTKTIAAMKMREANTAPVVEIGAPVEIPQ